jgi:hypothetical protein
VNPSAPPNNDWVILKAEKQGKVSLCRLRKSHPPAGFPTLIRIVWEYSGEEYNGFPHPDARKMMDDFEDAVGPVCDKHDFSRLMLVITGLGLKEWSFYAKDFNAFMLEFNHLMNGKPVVPIKIVYEQDPEFKYWSRYRKNVNEPC